MTAREHTGVCHLTVTAGPCTDVSRAPLRVVMTHDVTSGESRTCLVFGPDEACLELRRWLRDVCDRAAAP